MELVKYPNPMYEQIEPQIKTLKAKVGEHDRILGELCGAVESIKSETLEIRKITKAHWAGTSCLRKFGVALLIIGVMQMLATVWWAGRTESAIVIMSDRLAGVESKVADATVAPSIPAMATSYIADFFNIH